MKIQIKKLSDNAIIPTRGSEGAAGYDLYSTENVDLYPSERYLFKTDISMVIPEGYYGKIAPRSGLAFKNGISVLGGIIDQDYRGNIGVILLNTQMIDLDNEDGYSAIPVKITKNQRIAQIIFEKYYTAEFEEVDNLEDSSRGQNGYGSTGI